MVIEPLIAGRSDGGEPEPPWAKGKHPSELRDAELAACLERCGMLLSPGIADCLPWRVGVVLDSWHADLMSEQEGRAAR